MRATPPDSPCAHPPSMSRPKLRQNRAVAYPRPEKTPLLRANPVVPSPEKHPTRRPAAQPPTRPHGTRTGPAGPALFGRSTFRGFHLPNRGHPQQPHRHGGTCGAIPISEATEHTHLEKSGEGEAGPVQMRACIDKGLTTHMLAVAGTETYSHRSYSRLLLSQRRCPSWQHGTLTMDVSKNSKAQQRPRSKKKRHRPKRDHATMRVPPEHRRLHPIATSNPVRDRQVRQPFRYPPYCTYLPSRCTMHGEPVLRKVEARQHFCIPGHVTARTSPSCRDNAS
jgi:hypothetical protein